MVIMNRHRKQGDTKCTKCLVYGVSEKRHRRAKNGLKKKISMDIHN